MVFSLTVLSILEVVTNIVKVLLLVEHVDEVLLYKPEGHVPFSMGAFQILHESNTSGGTIGPGVFSACERNEYQQSFLGG